VIIVEIMGLGNAMNANPIPEINIIEETKIIMTSFNV
jgi:hypothetical protein